MDLNKIKEPLEKRINELGFDLVSLQRKIEKGDVIISIVVDRVEAIDMNTIVSLSEELSSYIDTLDNSNEKYFLDISSLGAEKPLKVEELKKYEGRYVNVHVNNALNGLNIFEGDMITVTDKDITVSYREKTRVKQVVILLSNIYKIRLAIKF